MARIPSRVLRTLMAVSLPLLAAAAWWGFRRPSLSREWVVEQARLPGVTVHEDRVDVAAVRDFRFGGDGSVRPGYRAHSYPLDQLERVWFVVVPFNRSWRGPAHTFATFGFSDGTYVSVSVEARRERGERYSIWKGLLRQYELTYIVAEERDAIGLRAIAWGDPVYLFPIRASREQVRGAFLQMMRRAETLEREPSFYNTLTDNCTKALLDAANTVAREPIRYGPRVLMAGYADAVAYENGLIDTDLPLAAARARFRVDAKARAAASDPEFSRRIRE
jgi:hypothetical protein